MGVELCKIAQWYVCVVVGRRKILGYCKASLLNKPYDTVSTLPLPKGSVLILSISLKFM